LPVDISAVPNRTIVLLVVVLATGVGVAAWEGLCPK